MIPSRYKPAIARIEVRQGDTVATWGTGFLVAKGKILTAYHVVADRAAAVPSPYPGVIWACFPNAPAIEVAATFEPVWSDPSLDFALLTCEDAPDVPPIPLRWGLNKQGKRIWSTYGFPTISDHTRRYGKTHVGEVRDWQTLYGAEGAPVLELYCTDAAAGNGEPVSGVSGAPCIVYGHAVGVIRAAPKDKKGRVVSGMLYASPVDKIAACCEKLIRLEEPLPFEDYASELIEPCKRMTLRLMIESIRAEVPDDLDDDLLRQAFVTAMLVGGADLTARALSGARPMLERVAIDRLVDMAGAAWVREEAASAMRAFVNARPSGKAVALNTDEPITGEMYIVRATGRSNAFGWDFILVIAGSVDTIVTDARSGMKSKYGCDTDAELDDELEQLDRGDQNDLYVFVHEPAHREELIDELRSAFTQRHLHIVWLTGASPFGDLQTATQMIEYLLPEIQKEEERIVVSSIKKARKRVQGYFQHGAP
jgi:hypothetical protein